MENTFKRFLSLVLAFTMVLSYVPVNAFADEGNTEPCAEHAYTITVVTNPTCTEGGFTTYTCSVCGASYTDGATEALGHSYASVVTAPTCTADGYTTYTCADCGDSYTGDAVASSGHSFVDGACTVCSEPDPAKQETTEAPEEETTEAACSHEYASVVTAPTCTEAGFTTYTCGLCGDSYTADQVAAAGHSFVDGKCTCGEVEETQPEVDEQVVAVQAMINALRTEINEGEEEAAKAEYDAATAAITALTDEQRAQLDLTNYYAAAVPTVIPAEQSTGLSGSGTAEDPYQISSVADLKLIRDAVNGGTDYYSGKYIVLTTDIDLAGENWTPIGSASMDHGFMGNFDGNTYKIKNLKIENPAIDNDGYAYAGLFGVTEGTDKDNQNVIKNLTIENVTISTTGHIVSAAIAYPYYTNVDNVKVCGNISITGGNYTSGVLAYTRRCVNASNLSVEGESGSTITGKTTVGGVISDIQMNGGLTAEYSNFSVSGVTISGEMNVGGISGIISEQTLDTCAVNDIVLNCSDARMGVVSGSMGGTSTIANVTTNMTGSVIGATYDSGTAVQAKIGNKYYATLKAACDAAQSGETISLVADSENENELSIPNGVKLELNGFTASNVKTPAVMIGTQGYATLADALTAAASMTGDVTVEIYDKVTLNQSLSGSFTSIKFVGKDTDAEIYLDVQGYITATGKKVAFEGLPLSKSAGGFVTNAGFMNTAFGVYDVTEVTYTNCTFANGAYASSGKVTFNGCTFKRSHDKYGLWAYGDVEAVVDGCTFADYRGIKMYAEGAAKTVDLTVKNTNFSAVDSKPAIVLTYGESVTLVGNTYSSTGVFELDLDGAPNGTAVTSDVTPTCVNDNGACGVLVDGKIYTTVAQAAEVATSGSNVTLLHDSTETVELPEGVVLDKNGYKAAGVTVAAPVAQIGEKTYTSLQAAVDAVQNGETITLLADCAEAITFTQTADKSFVLNGNGKTMNGSINITARAGKDAPSTLEIKNFNFETDKAKHTFIQSVETNYYPNNITISDCTFKGTGEDYSDVLPVSMKSANNLKIVGCTATNVHSLLQNTAGWNITVQKTTVTGLRGISLGSAQGVLIEEVTINASEAKYGIRADAAYANTLTIKNSKISAFIPVVIRKASADYGIVFEGTNTMTPANTDGLWCAIGTSEYDTNGTMPTAATGKVTVTLNDAGLDKKGMYGHYVAPPAGSGTEDDPILITSLEDLEWLRDKVDEQAADGSTQFAGKFFKLTADIDLAGINWNPIGSMSGDHGTFKGVFDGDGHTISNLNVQQAGNGLGLFARTAGNAVIKNLTLNNVTVKSTDNSNYVGGLVGNSFASTKIENVHVTGTIDISGRGYIGGISGHGYVVMDNVSVKGTGTISSTFWCAGGILGYGGEGTTNIQNAHVEGITITSAAGGLGAIVGMAEDNEGTQPISGSNLSAKNVTIKTYTGDYGDSYANYALGYLYGGNPTSKLTGTLAVENVKIETSNGEIPEVQDAVATIGNAVFFNLQDAFNAGGEVKLLRNVTLTDTVTVPADKTVTLDLNGKIISQTKAQTAGYEMILNDGNLTIQDSVGNGKISYTDSGNGGEYTSNTITNRGTLTLKSGTVENLSSETVANNGYPYAIDTSIWGAATEVNTVIKGGKVAGESYSAMRLRADSETKAVNVTVTGGEVVGTIEVQNPSSTVAGKGKLTISGGKLSKSGTDNVLYFFGFGGAGNNIVVSVTGGEFGGEIKQSATYPVGEGFNTKFITGGTFNSNSVETFLASGYKLDYKNGKFIVQAEVVANVNGDDYSSLAEAIKNANGAPVYLKKNITLSETITIEQPVTLNLKGYTITGADGAVVFEVKADTTITNGSIKGNKSGTSSGLIDIYADLNLKDVTLETTKINALRFKAGECTATLENCNVTGAFKGYGDSVWNIVSGTYKASSTSINDQLNGTAAVSGGTFHYAIAEEKCAPGYVTVNNGDGTYTVKYAPAAFIDANNNGTPDAGEAVYGNLDQVFANHKSGDVRVVLTSDIVANGKVDTAANAHYYLTTNVAEGVKVDFLYEDNWNYAQKMSIGENITLNAKYFLGWTDIDIYGTVITDYAYFTGADVVVHEGAKLTAKTGDATVQVKGGTKLTVNGEVDTAILNVWTGVSELKVSGANAKVTASWIDIWDGTPSVTVENGATLESDKMKASRGGEITVNGATLDAELELGHNGESAGKLTVTGNSTVSGAIKLTAADSTLTGPEGMNVITGVDGYMVVHENGVYKLVSENCNVLLNGAYKTWDEALAQAQSGDTITLLKDIEVTEAILIDKNLTIEGDGHKVTSSASRVFRVTASNVEVTLKDVNMVSNAVRVGTNDIRGISIDASLSNVKLTLNNCSVDFTDASANDWTYAVNVCGSGTGHTVTVTGGTYEGANVINAHGTNNTIVVKDATINCLYPNNDMYAGSCIWVLQEQGSKVEATGNTFNGNNAVAFNLGTGTILTQSNNTDNTKYVIAKIGATYYTDLHEALTNAKNGETVVLLHDVDLAGIEWEPVNFENRSFDGGNHTISNLVINGGSASDQGFFSKTTNGEIKNVTFHNAKVTGRLNVGVVAGTPYTSKYTNIKVTGHVEVEGMAYVGGVGGKNAYADWTNITVDVDESSYVKATSTENGKAYRTYVGGVVGFNGEGSHTFKNISSNIKVIGDVCDIGGLFGIAHYGNNFENVTFTGSVEAPADAEEVGGIAGVWHNQKGYTVTFTNVSSTGSVTVGNVTTTGSIVGGAYNSENQTADTSGSLIIDGEEAWLAVAKIGTARYETLAEAIAAVQEDETVTILAGTLSEGTIKLPAALKNVTIKGEEGAVLKDMTISAADGNSYSYVGLTFDGITFDNSRIILTGWRNGDETIENLTVTNCTFKNLDDTTNSAPVHINKDASEAVKNFTFTNNVIDGATGGSKSGVYAQVTGKTTFTGNTINNVSFRPYVIQVTTDDGIADEFTVTGNTFSGSAVGRTQGLGSNAEGTDTVKLVVSDNIFKGITDAQQICYWNFNPETTTADLSRNYYDIDIQANPGKIYYNSSAKNADDLIEMGVYPYYADEAKTQLVEAPAIMVTYPVGNPVYPEGKVEYYNDMLDAVPYTTNCPRLEGATITLLKDTSGAGLRFMENDMVFDLNGHTYTITAGTGSQGTNTSGFQIRPEVTTDVIFKNGTINVAAGAPVVWMFNCYAIDFIVENVTVDCANMAWSYGESCYVVVSREGDNVQFTGTTKIENFNSQVAGNAINVGGTMTIRESVVPGGSIELDVGATLTAPEGLTVKAPEGYAVVYKDGVYSTALYVAETNGTKYVSLQDAINAGSQVKLLADVALTETVTIPAGKTVTLDLNGQTISQTKEQTEGYQMILNDGNLNINDSSADGTGKISYTDSGNGGNYISDTIYNRGILVINGGTIENLSSETVANNGFPHAVDTYSGIRNTSVTINGGTIYCAEYSAIRMFCVSATNKADLIINGGTIKGSVDMQNGTAAAALGSLTVNGGTFKTTKNTNNIRFANWNSGAETYGITAEVKGGTFNGGFSDGYVPAAANWNKNIISGGTFTGTVVEGFLAEGYILSYISGSGNQYGVEMDAVARVGTTTYSTIQAAIDAAPYGQTVYVLKDVELKAPITVAAGKKLTLDLMGSTITGKPAEAAAYAVITNKGDLTIANGTVKCDHALAGSTAYAVNTIVNSGTLTIDGAVIENVSTAEYQIGYAIDNNSTTGNAVLTINSGKVTASDSKYYDGIRLFCNNQTAVNSVTVNGGEVSTIWLQNPSDGSAERNTKDVKGNVTITDGTVGALYLEPSANFTASVKGGHVNKVAYNESAEGRDLTGIISGGTFTEKPDDKLAAEGYRFVQDEANQVYGVEPMRALSGTGTQADPYLITNLDELILFRESVNKGETKYSAPGVWVALGADIDMTGENWTPIGSPTADHGFMGNFDGKGYTIKNLAITDPTLDSDGYAYAGLFAITEGTETAQNVIQNLTIENVTISTTGHIVSAAIAYPYYTTVDNITVCGDISITGGDYTSGVLAYTRRCTDASNLSVVGNDGSTITGKKTVGGVISDIQTNGGLTADYSGFHAENVTVTGDMHVGGISGIIGGQTLNGATVKNVTLVCDDNRVGQGAGSLGQTSTITNAAVENVTGAKAVIGGVFDNGAAVEAKIGDVYYATFKAAHDAAEAGDTITLLAPVTVPAGETLTLDKAVDICYTTDVAGEAMFTNNGTMTVDGANLVFTYTGAADSAYGKGNYTVINGGELTLKSGSIENATAKMSHASYAVQNGGNATFTMDGGLVKNTNNYAIRQFTSGSQTNTVTINGGEVIGTRAVWIQAAGSNADNAPTIALNVNGGTLTGTGESDDYKLAVYSYSYGDSLKNVSVKVTDGTVNGDIALTGGMNKNNIETVNISGGTFNGYWGEIFSYGDETAAEKAITITGGQFRSADAEIYASSEGFEFTRSGRMYVPTAIQYIAQIGEGENAKKFKTLQEAVDFARENDIHEIDLLNDGGYAMVKDTLTVNRNGKTAEVAALSGFKTVENESAYMVVEASAVTGDNGPKVAYIVGDESNTMALQDALDAAKENDTVRLTTDLDIADKAITIPAGVTLDIEAHTLKVKYMIGLTGSKLTANTMKGSTGTGSGYLIINKDNLKLAKECFINSNDYGVLPVWNPANNWYEFTQARAFWDPTNVRSHTLTVTEEKIFFQFRHQVGSYYQKNLLNDGGLDNGIKVIVTLAYETQNGTAEQTFVYNEGFFKTVNNSTSMDYTFTLESYENIGVSLDKNVTITAAVVTDCGVAHYLDDIDVNLK